MATLTAKKGLVVRLKNVPTNVGLSTNKLYVVTETYSGDTTTIQVDNNNHWINSSQYEIVSITKELLHDMNDQIDLEIEQLQAVKKSNLDKIIFLTENDLESLDENEYKVVKTLDLLETDLSKIEKAKLIAKLING